MSLLGALTVWQLVPPAPRIREGTKEESPRGSMPLTPRGRRQEEVPPPARPQGPSPEADTPHLKQALGSLDPTWTKP